MFANTLLNATTFNTLNLIKILSNEQCSELMKNIRKSDCRTSFNKVVTGFMPLAFSVAVKYRHRGDINDLFQVACLNLMDAARTFDENHKIHFSTHARTWINHGLKRHLLLDAGLIKVPDNKGILKCYRRMNQFNGSRQPSPSVIEAFIKPLGATNDEFMAAYDLYFATFESTNLRVDDDSDQMESRLTTGVTLEDEVIARDEEEHSIKTLNRLLNGLSEREQNVIRARMLQEEPVQLRIVGDSIGVSSERVRQIEKSALNKIRLAA